MTNRDRVNRGAELLDKVLPEWYKHINVDILDISDPNNCILGQLYTGYVRGLNTLKKSGHYIDDNIKNRIYHGFTLSLHASRQAISTRSFYLKRYWTEAINERKNGYESQEK